METCACVSFAEIVKKMDKCHIAPGATVTAVMSAGWNARCAKRAAQTGIPQWKRVSIAMNWSARTATACSNAAIVMETSAIRVFASTLKKNFAKENTEWDYKPRLTIGDERCNMFASMVMHLGCGAMLLQGGVEEADQGSVHARALCTHTAVGRQS